MLTFFNATPHPIYIYREEDSLAVPEVRKLILKGGATPILEIPPSGKLLNAVQKNREVTFDVPFLKGGQVFVAVDDYGAIAEDIVVVSALFKSAAAALGLDTSRLANVQDIVYDGINNPPGLRPVGCLSLAVG
jgi:hypothetical protein